ncbi:hypothetical protein Tco_0302421, partial [Tanacetum coccineum]
ELKAIADMMIRVGYEKECCQVYSNVNGAVWDPPDSPLAPQWYCLEGGDDPNAAGKVSGDVQLSV